MKEHYKEQEKWSDVFFEVLCSATKAIAPEYFNLPIAGLPDPIFRERVYCYELYHQLRIRLPRDYPYSLGGEVDKSAHPLMQGDGVRNTIPDLLIHRPGFMEGNLIIIEIKPGTARIGELMDDVRKIYSYLSTAKYYKGVLLIYGDNQSSIYKVIRRALRSVNSGEIPSQNLKRICLYWHRNPGSPAEFVEWIA